MQGVRAAVVGSEERKLAAIRRRGAARLGTGEAVSGGEKVEVFGVVLDAGGQGWGGEDAVEGVAQVFEFVVEGVAVMAEVILQAFEQVGGEVGAVAARIAVGGDGVELGDEQGVVALLGAGQASLAQPGGGPAQGVDEVAAVAMELGATRRIAGGIEALLDGAEQRLEGGAIGREAGGRVWRVHGAVSEPLRRASQGMVSRAACTSAVVRVRRLARAADSKARCRR